MNEMIPVSERMPPEGKYVLVRLDKDNWHDDTDPEGVYHVVAKLVRGISEEQRAALPESDPRKRVYRSEDEHDNNTVPYCWEQFGADDGEFGQNVTHWFPIPKTPAT